MARGRGMGLTYAVAMSWCDVFGHLVDSILSSQVHLLPRLIYQKSEKTILHNIK